MTPGVQGHTNLKTDTAISSVAKVIEASCVILIDSIHTDSFGNLASTIQISTEQMMIKGRGHIFSQESLGIPIVGIGVPLVMRYAQGDDPDSNELIMRTGIAGDLESAASTIAYGISRTAYPKVRPKELAEIMKAI